MPPSVDRATEVASTEQQCVATCNIIIQQPTIDTIGVCNFVSSVHPLPLPTVVRQAYLAGNQMFVIK